MVLSTFFLFFFFVFETAIHREKSPGILEKPFPPGKRTAIALTVLGLRYAA